jgi:uncharacterized protein (DUF58 family)
VNPIVYPLLVLVPLVLLARSFRVFPDRRMMWLAAVPLAASLALVFDRQALWWPLMTLDGALILIAVADALTIPRRSVFSVEREVGRVASLEKSHAASLIVNNAARRGFRLSIRDDVDEQLAAEPDQFDIRIAPRSRATLHYTLRPRRRGAFRLAEVYIRVRSRFGLWQRLLDYPCENAIHVYPDMKQLGEYAVLARTNRLSLLGVRRTRKIGQDNEFERLRDYTLDDNYKHIDWRTTARRGKLTVKDYQSSQSQRIIFLVDCGRMMTNEASGVSLLDHALNAALMLSYVALRQGDAVGMIAFSDEIHSFVPARSGMNQMNHLLHASFDRFPRLVESRYDQAFVYLNAHCRKRALVVLASNVIDEVNAHQVERYLANLSGKHLPLAVLLRDHRLFSAVDAYEPQGTALYRAAAAAEILSWRRQVLSNLQQQGVLALDVFPEQMTAPLVNQYLEVKARHLL